MAGALADSTHDKPLHLDFPNIVIRVKISLFFSEWEDVRSHGPRKRRRIF